jgi:hypothetical protein
VRPDGRSIAEIPIAVSSIGGVPLGVGGGYFRLYPYRLTRFLLRRLDRSRASPFTFYLHPWELDPRQPRLALSWWRRWRQYQGLESTEPRLRRLLGDFRFADIASLLGDLELEPIALEGARVPSRGAAGSAPATAPAVDPSVVATGAIAYPAAEPPARAVAYQSEQRRGSGTR